MTETANGKQKEQSNKKTGKLSDQDLRELMGTYRPRYLRKRGGAFIQR